MSVREKKLPNIAVLKEEKEFEKHLLNYTIKLSDGTKEKVFTRGLRNDAQLFLYSCNICAVKNLPGEKVLQTHIQGKKHQSKLELPFLDATTFRAQLNAKKTTQIISEPAIPGLEDELPTLNDKPTTEGLDEISSFSDSSLSESGTANKNRSKSKSLSPFRKKLSERNNLLNSNADESSQPAKPTRTNLPTPKELLAQSSEIAIEGYKWEKFRVTVEIFVTKLNKDFKEYEKNPEKHPLYGEEWKKFWCRRFKELKAEGKDAAGYDYRPEWIKYWTIRMKELHDTEIDNKKKEIRAKLKLPAEGEEKTEILKEQYRVKVPTNKKPIILNKSPVKISSSSSDEERKSKHNDQKRKKDVDKRRGKEKFRRRSDSDDSDDYRSRDRDRQYRKRYSREREYYRERSPIYRRLPPNLEYPPPMPPHIRERSERYREYRRYMETSYEKPSYDEWYAKTIQPHIPRPHQPSPPKPATVTYEQSDMDDGPITFVTVCRLLTALEEELGEKLGNKVTDLLCKALSLEKVKANSADEVLLTEDNCQFLEVIKERLKGRMMAEIVPPHKIHAVKKACRNIANLLYQASERITEDKPKEPEVKTKAPEITKIEVAPLDKKILAIEITQALLAQGKNDLTPEELEEIIQAYVKMKETQVAEESADKKESPAREKSPEFVEKIIEPTIRSKTRSRSRTPSDHFEVNRSPILVAESPHKDKIIVPSKKIPKKAENNLNSLTDEDLQTLLQSFFELSADEQKYLIEYLKEIEKTDPLRVEKLRKYVKVDENDKSVADDYDEDMEAGPSAPKSTKYESPVPPKKVVSQSDSEDDYNFEEVFKPKNTKPSNKSNFLLNDKQSMIQNLMGSLQNSVQHDVRDVLMTNSIPSISNQGNQGSSEPAPRLGETPYYQYQSEYDSMMGQMFQNYSAQPQPGEYSNNHFYDGMNNMNSYDNGPPQMGRFGNGPPPQMGPYGNGPPPQMGPFGNGPPQMGPYGNGPPQPRPYGNGPPPGNYGF